MKILAAIVGILLFAVSNYISYERGAGDVRMSTIVSYGYPYYRGVFHGTCADLKDQDGNLAGQFCATER